MDQKWSPSCEVFCVKNSIAESSGFWLVNEDYVRSTYPFIEVSKLFYESNHVLVSQIVDEITVQAEVVFNGSLSSPNNETKIPKSSVIESFENDLKKRFDAQRPIGKS